MDSSGRYQLEANSNNPNCPACRAGRLPSPDEVREFHPLAGHGYTREQGWSHPEAKRIHDLEIAEAVKKAEEARG
jgi:hypothetical protein